MKSTKLSIHGIKFRTDLSLFKRSINIALSKVTEIRNRDISLYDDRSISRFVGTISDLSLISESFTRMIMANIRDSYVWSIIILFAAEKVFYLSSLKVSNKLTNLAKKIQSSFEPIDILRIV